MNICILLIYFVFYKMQKLLQTELILNTVSYLSIFWSMNFVFHFSLRKEPISQLAESQRDREKPGSTFWLCSTFFYLAQPQHTIPSTHDRPKAASACRILSMRGWLSLCEIVEFQSNEKAEACSELWEVENGQVITEMLILPDPPQPPPLRGLL